MRGSPPPSTPASELAELQLRKFQKELSAGTVSLALLAVLGAATDPMYGYQIAKRLEQVGQGVLAGKQSALYPVLRNLESAALLDSFVHYDSAIASLSIALGHDASGFDPDGPLPEIPDTIASKSGRERTIELVRRENLTVRQLAQRLGGYGGLAFVGTPVTIADQMEEWLTTRGSDGFNVMFPYLPEGLDDFVDKVVPELQRRGLFRREYAGKTLRENLGLPRPQNRFFAR